MSKQALASAIREAAASLRNEPSQFSFSINVQTIGMRSVANGGGIGTQVNTVGGPGSGSVTGLRVSVSTGDTDVRITQAAAAEGLKEKMEAWADDLQAVAGEVEAANPDRGFLARKLEKLTSSGLPTAIVGLVTAIVAAVTPAQ